jgi:hypothetical protein
MSAVPSIVIEIEQEDGSYLETALPSKFEVCGKCAGSGSHVNEAIDGNGITSSEMDELGDDFREDYMAGVYDVQCTECKGLRVVPVVDADRCPAELLAKYHAHQEEEFRYQAECAAERRMGA